MNKKENDLGDRSHHYVKVTLVILVIVFLTLCAFLVWQVHQYRVAPRRGPVSAERIHFTNFAQQHSLAATDVGLIEPWMTFDYVGVSFKVPPADIATALGIASTTPGYPNITLGRYARMISTTSASFITNVRAVVQSYLAPPAGQ